MSGTENTPASAQAFSEAIAEATRRIEFRLTKNPGAYRIQEADIPHYKKEIRTALEAMRGDAKFLAYGHRDLVQAVEEVLHKAPDSVAGQRNVVHLHRPKFSMTREAIEAELKNPVRGFRIQNNDPRRVLRPQASQPSGSEQGFLQRLSTEEKVGIGMNVLVAALALVDGARRLADCRETDAQTGEKKMSYGSAAIGAIELLLGIGIAAVTHDQLRPHSPILSR